MTAYDENGTSRTFLFYPLKIQFSDDRNDLDYSLKIDLGDVGELLPTELDAVASASGFGEKPVVKYRTYRGDDLSAPLFGPLILEVTQFTFNRVGCSFEARAPIVSLVKTGERYTLASVS